MYFKMEIKEDEQRDDTILMSTNDSEYESDASTTMEDCNQVLNLTSVKRNVGTVQGFDKKITMSVESGSVDGMNSSVINSFKWLNRLKSTTFHMFICHPFAVDYVKNERYPADVYAITYAGIYGNAFELLVRDCKFYITTSLLRQCKTDKSWYPQETVVKHIDTCKMSLLLQLRLTDNATLQCHIVEAMINTMFVGLSVDDVVTLRMRMSTKESCVSCMDIQNRYSWKSEERKVKHVSTSTTTTTADNTSTSTMMFVSHNNKSQCDDLFDTMYANKCQYFFKTDTSLIHDDYIVDFFWHLNRHRKPVTGYLDYVSNAKMIAKDLAAIMFDGHIAPLQDLKNVEGCHKDVDDFMRLSAAHPHGDVLLCMKTSDTNSQKYRLNCFRTGHTHVWINSLVYSNIKRLDLQDVIKKYNWGVHHVVTFDYMYNSKMSKVHTVVVKLIMRYILSKRDLALLNEDFKICKKIKYNVYKCE
ncbi:ie-1 [Clostera anastomosis granulovirus A]|uniref:Ie-1 n=1 Tax=Clostera anastomosis granulovirus A TaxID=1986289 RepID=U5KB71_9BBAC|nr:ie-1 [Clostera anastomosis granulovirus Henan]AGQ20265.1 ie-1 [Clostera anastomosis granulovirus Henan]